MQIRIKKVSDKAIIPTRLTKHAAGYDLYACTNTMTVISPHQTVRIRTGLAIEIPEGLFALVVARGGLTTKQALRVGHGVATIDADFKGEWSIPLYNDSDIPQTINPMECVAQFIVMPCMELDFEQVAEL